MTSFSLDRDETDAILTGGVDIAKNWPEEKKIRLIQKMFELDAEETAPEQDNKSQQGTGAGPSNKVPDLSPPIIFDY